MKEIIIAKKKAFKIPHMHAINASRKVIRGPPRIFSSSPKNKIEHLHQHRSNTVVL